MDILLEYCLCGAAHFVVQRISPTQSDMGKSSIVYGVLERAGVTEISLLYAAAKKSATEICEVCGRAIELGNNKCTR